MALYEASIALHSPMTEDEWDIITDVDFDNTDKVTFSTKHGKEVVFKKERLGRWEERHVECENPWFRKRFYCTACEDWQTWGETKYCPNCGAKMDLDEPPREGDGE